MPILSLIQRKKIPMEQAVELSIELAPYLKAYNNYKNKLIDKENSAQLPSAALEYKRHREALLDSLSPVTGGSLVYVFDMAMDHHMSALKGSAAYEALDDSFVEILKNSVDEAIERHITSPNGTRSVNTLKATLTVTIDDKTNPANVTISCVDNGRGFKPAFLEQVATINARKIYMATTRSNKLAAARSFSNVPLFTGGRGLGLRMLMQKIDQGTFLEVDRKHATSYYKAPVSDIVFSNKIDVSGHIDGAVITITTSKQPVVKEQLQGGDFNPKRIRTHFTEALDRNKENNCNQSTKPTLTIDTDDFDDTVQGTDGYSPGN